MGENQFSAAASALGYLYQCRVALLLLIGRGRSDPSAVVSLESLDDIEFESGANVQDLLQTKHHKKGGGSLTNASGDLWKTLRIWAAGVKAKQIRLPGATLSILTTGIAPQSSAASLLRDDDKRDPKAALGVLRGVAAISESEANEPAYAEFQGLSQLQQELLVDAIYVLDGSPVISDIEKEIENELRLATKPHLLPALRSRLEGWWFSRVVDALAGKGPKTTRAEQLENEVRDISDQLRDDNLPIDPEAAEAEAPAGLEDRVFVHQLKLAGIPPRKLRWAIRDYFRAYTQRSAWLRDQLIGPRELERYEKRVAEEWERHFDEMCDELGDSASEDKKKEAARALYNWAEFDAEVFIRPRCEEPFVTRGTFHALADRLAVGWHQDFKDRLIALLDTLEKSA